ncbi:MAG: peptide deformylase [Pseudomonadota bacterium]|nr:peptide deformylase [Pseudomonadota bacterium]
MSLLSILHFPDSRLHLKAKEVVIFDEKLHQLVQDMADTMYENKGIGLAATQVNVQQQVIIMDLSGSDEPRNLMVLINPKIIDKKGEVVSEEGCLSVPGVYESVKRSENIQVKYQDISGAEHSLDCDGLLAVCIQHEVDHLMGKVFVEYLSALKQTFIKKKMHKIFKPK